MKKDIVVVGASAGGVEALGTVLAGVRPGFSGTICVVLHMHAGSRSHLPEILQRHCELPVEGAVDGGALERGRVYVARPDFHMVLERDTVRLTRGPRENRHRPSADSLFRSAAYAYGPRVVGVVLSGALDDGSSGMWWVKRQGGTAIVQSPEDALVSAMPENVLEYVAPDHVLRAAEIGPLLTRLSQEYATSPHAEAAKLMEVENKISLDGNAFELGILQFGEPAPYTCPECHGVLVHIKGDGVPRFRCHTGHAYSANTLLAEITDHVEHAIWDSVRRIEESAMLMRQMANATSDQLAAQRFREKAVETLARAAALRQAVLGHQTLSEDNVREVKARKR
jgi:two-component system, chemotaxis family, protein-glutamate methylesterase/glutaminase